MAFTCFQLSNVRRIGGTQHRTASPLRRRSSAATHAHHHPIPPCALRPITLLRCVSKPMSSLTLRWVAQWRWLQQGRLALGAGSAGRSIFVWNAPPPATPHPATRTALTKQLMCVFHRMCSFGRSGAPFAGEVSAPAGGMWGCTLFSRWLRYPRQCSCVAAHGLCGSRSEVSVTRTYTFKHSGKTWTGMVGRCYWLYPRAAFALTPLATAPFAARDGCKHGHSGPLRNGFSVEQAPPVHVHPQALQRGSGMWLLPGRQLAAGAR